MTTNALWRHLLAATSLCLSLVGAAHSEDAGTVVQSIGDAQLGNTAAKVGDLVRAGDVLSTGPNGYIYIKTVDAGFLILRPRSKAKIQAYHIDPSQPANNRIKIELNQGVARSISGEAAKQSRQNFRFNTPVAAIGIRGTDFTVFTDDQTTRVAVVSGGVVVSGFSADCSAAGPGPCEGNAKRELFASAEAQLLQVNRGQAVPQLLKGSTLLPDTNTPPRADEPTKKSAINNNSAVSSVNISTDLNLSPRRLASLDAQALQAESATAPTPPAIVWGRWQTLVDQPAGISLTALRTDNKLVGVNAYYALLRNKDSVWQPLTGGSASFSLQGSQVVVQADGAGTISPASLENGKLTVDFAASSFTTQFDLLTEGKRLLRQAEGTVFKDGTFGNVSQFLGRNNMVVQGAMAQNPNLTAGYLFESRLDTGQVATGVTYWTK